MHPSATREKSLNTRFRLIAVAGACAISLGLAACSDDGDGGGQATDTPSVAPTDSAPADGTQPLVPTDVSMFEGSWVHDEVYHLACDAEANCTLTVEASAGSSKGTVKPAEGDAYTLELVHEGGERDVTYTITFEPGGDAFAAAGGDGRVLRYTRDS